LGNKLTILILLGLVAVTKASDVEAEWEPSQVSEPHWNPGHKDFGIKDDFDNFFNYSSSHVFEYRGLDGVNWHSNVD